MKYIPFLSLALAASVTFVACVNSSRKTVSEEDWSTELLYPLLQPYVYTKCLTPEARTALSLKICELYQIQHPECPDAFAIMPKLVADTRAQAEKASKKQGRVWGWITYLLLILIVYLPDPYVSDIEYVVVTVPSKPNDNPEHIHLLTKEKLTQLFNAAGCTKLHFDGVEGHLFMVAGV